jgi:hypothetical protein
MITTPEIKKRKIIPLTPEKIKKLKLEVARKTNEEIARRHKGACPVDELDSDRRRKFLDREMTI